MNWDDRSVTDGMDISSMFADFFKSTYEVNWQHDPKVEKEDNTMLNNDFCYLHEFGDANLTQFEVTYDEVLKVLLSMDTCESSGPDEIPNIGLNKCAVGICDPVTHLFSTEQRSIS